MADNRYQEIGAGRETDLLIAEKLFGKRPAESDPYREDEAPIPFYTTNEKDALELLEAVFEKFHPIWRQDAAGHYEVMNFAPDSDQLLPGWRETEGRLCAEGASLPLAIGRFVLLWYDRAGGGK
jgi:hypothetical protein